MQKSVDLFTTNLNGRKIAFCISLFCTLALTKMHFIPTYLNEICGNFMVHEFLNKENYFLKKLADFFRAKVQVWHGLTAASDAKFESVKVHEGLILRTTAYC